MSPRSQLRLNATIEPAGPAVAIVLSDDQVADLRAARKNPPVTVTIGGVTVRVRIARMGGRNLIGFRKDLREQLGIAAGDRVDALIAVDEEERAVEVPAELTAALTPDQRSRFADWSYTRRMEAARSVAEAKKAETRDRRIAKILAELD